jgi:hypothetical protein
VTTARRLVLTVAIGAPVAMAISALLDWLLPDIEHVMVGQALLGALAGLYAGIALHRVVDQPLAHREQGTRQRLADGRHVVTLVMRRVPPWYRLVYRARGLTPPIAAARFWPGALVPMRWRRFHERYARHRHLYWIPCILCSRPHGGHEITDTVPDPTYGQNAWAAICPYCTIERRGPGWWTRRKQWAMALWRP